MYSTITQFNNSQKDSTLLFYTGRMPLICVTAWWY